MSRAEVDLQISVRKACNAEEVPPKRKHVRACIVYTWDHKNSRAFWNAVKIQPLQSSEIQLFKALIMIHKVLQEGHPNTLKDSYRNKDFLYSLSTVFPSSSSYGRLINQYDRFLLSKLDFHRNNPGFNGMFEYEEYISLRTVNDPNEGYESILQLMDLQDSINELQKLIFVTIHQSPNNLCKVSALVPLISESYGIYKFLISMLRAMYQQLGDDEALSVLFERFDSQHFLLRDFYTDCQSIKFLTSLITIPRLGGNPPNLRISDDSENPSTDTAPVSNDSTSHLSQQPTSNVETPSLPPPVDSIHLQQTGIFDQQQQFQQQQQYLEAQRQQQLAEQAERQRMFEQQKREQEQRRLQEQEYLRQQQTQAQVSRVSELEHDLVMFKNQFDNDQALLQQYDARVNTLENELAKINETATQQVASKDEQIKTLEEQVNNWAKKYEALAKLYSQLRSEHLNLLAKFKKIQQKISSAQESILKTEKVEKDLKAKNLELADLIRERDRARLDLDRTKASKDQEIEKLQAEIRELNAQMNDSGKLHSTNLDTLLSKHQQEIDRLNAELVEKDMKLTSLGDISEIQEKLKEKDVDIEIAQESLDSALQELATSKKFYLEHGVKKLLNLLDVILANNVRRIQDSKHELSSPMQAGNSNASPEYLLSVIDLCSDTATDFAQAFNNFIAESNVSYEDPEDSTHSEIILASSELTATINDLMLNAKGLSRNLSTSDEESLVSLISTMLTSAESFFSSLTSDTLDELDSDDDKIDFVIDCNVSFQHSLQDVSSLVDKLRGRNSSKLIKGKIEDAVDNEMDETAKAVDSATEFLNKLLLSASQSSNFEIHESIVSAALSITKAIQLLIIAATKCQREIVDRNKGNGTRRDFYKKNNRWTEGLVSAAKAVAGATNILIQTADGVLKNENSHEQLIVACNEVAASTAQLVAAARVKANFMSKSQDDLEGSSRTVNTACKSLVAKVQSLLTNAGDADQSVDLSKLTPYEGKTLEMEQQVEILKLENSLVAARKKLAEIRKFGYKDDVSDDEV
ncbi:putative DNA polymerase [Clavispora lusitaniae]|uniref:DNA polymerase n=1 Tax=Clavispora lusitaniae TaxID=36911 RepID=A0AA91T3E2_CLALS|nr:putative DNA polymerase [Clavispora lusitaniae]